MRNKHLRSCGCIIEIEKDNEKKETGIILCPEHQIEATKLDDYESNLTFIDEMITP